MSKVKIDDEEIEIQHLIVESDYDVNLYHPKLLKHVDPNEESWNTRPAGWSSDSFEQKLLQVIKQMDKRIMQLEAERVRSDTPHRTNTAAPSELASPATPTRDKGETDV